MGVKVWLCRFTLLCIVLGSQFESLYATQLKCDFYTTDDCENEEADERCMLGTKCNPSPDRRAYCMSQWKNTSGIIELTKQGCWGEDERCSGRTGCFEDRLEPGDNYFCCCDGTYCNNMRNIEYRPLRTMPDEEKDKDKRITCEYYDPQRCETESEESCNMTTELCEIPSEEKLVHCYASWQNQSGELTIIKKGCWLDHVHCISKSCVDTHVIGSKEDPLNFCCCTGSMCNVDVDLRFVLKSEAGVSDGPDKNPGRESSMTLLTLLCALVPLIVITLIIIIAFYCYKKRKNNFYREPLPTADPSPISPPSPILGLRPIQLLEVKARGRFGCVWKAQMLSEVVAVKIFPLQDRASYMNEKDIYQLPFFSSQDCVLRFIGGEKRGDTLNMELWLITEFHERGSLYDFLKGNVISWADAVKISMSITKGLAFLHDQIPANKNGLYKPTVVHRDFKSKNVLIKQDMTACIADLGLALKFERGKPVGETHGQVGTRRYMAPEVLEGSINFNGDSFIRIDMYACGLVLWEIVSRCAVPEVGPVEEYQLPFEEEIGQHPVLEDMQDVVVRKKHRPVLKDQWYSHPGLASISESIQECWDTDPEARLSATCVYERLAQLPLVYHTTSNSLVPVNTSHPLPPVFITSNTHLTPCEDSGLKDSGHGSLSA